MSDTFQTSDLALTTYLTINNFLFVNANRRDPKRVVFEFQETPVLLKHVEKFWNGKTLVEPFSFLQATKRIKAKIYT
ncbi:hypothetical protein A3E97_01585 [Candidatus Uhrbacteria bacterium RIFCSPHIGHO2_12_FULL_47_12]|uniref:DUF5659 domain-containing protein n=1 Tax=Candidatus Uhrbacteria bacterium RIFCSPLOWO2_02_FULL_48_18 TaxID=1802408 RepID=A0A1F7VCI8_9BACT|nr:MAG: hypothetical protein A3E97_01585 [Candidatus Uhrbacteria bacterium RIFCSPHIGHO2_12_FULL_47_12]OGL80581.1 MAG: hypothetical protein A3B20_04245 [Candidatus Uhrbacteria bacterium RIFCSPLOWO2_01_FULL_47_17]OGL88236.1 MAG: hypothetical protein A3I41_00735 [Candidatus Uhrbacteria bacterium RIFCSPLOWO2_02_FULL_48_18]OGL94251.1 MAG: hypothetical protein A3H12_02600 [Candidatus Uhrbacteria bacterium RIFCSPLOWO2_12_FULL_47_9]